MMPNDLEREIHKNQPECFTCGKPFTDVRYECPICGEWQCSEECRKTHIKQMDEV